MLGLINTSMPNIPVKVLEEPARSIHLNSLQKIRLIVPFRHFSFFWVLKLHETICSIASN